MEKVVVNPELGISDHSPLCKGECFSLKSVSASLQGDLPKIRHRVNTGVEVKEVKAWTPPVRGTCGTPSQMIHLEVVSIWLTLDQRLGVDCMATVKMRQYWLTVKRGLGIKLGCNTYLHNVLALRCWRNSLISLSLSQHGIAVLLIPWGYCESWIHVACLSQGLASVNALYALSVIKKESDQGRNLNSEFISKVQIQ